MIRFFDEAEEDICMDVQVGPGEEIVTCIDDAKKDPDTVPVGTAKSESGRLFYVSASDILRLADLNEASAMEALNAVIECNEEYGMEAANTILVMDENSIKYVRGFEHYGATCIRFVDEAEGDIDIEVQCGPNGEDMTVHADPQEANPVDAVKRQYDSVLVVKDGDDFFTDVEDVQKCADLNCESVIDTINKIIDIHEDYDMNAQNLHFVHEGILWNDSIEVLTESLKGVKGRNKIITDTANAIRKYLRENDFYYVTVSREPGRNAANPYNDKFIRGKGNRILLNITPSNRQENENRVETLTKGIKFIKAHKKDIVNAISNNTGKSVSNFSVGNVDGISEDFVFCIVDFAD